MWSARSGALQLAGIRQKKKNTQVAVASISRVCQTPSCIKKRASALTNLLIRGKVVPLTGDVVGPTTNQRIA
jgi:hypothetical protein